MTLGHACRFSGRAAPREGPSARGSAACRRHAPPRRPGRPGADRRRFPHCPRPRHGHAPRVPRSRVVPGRRPSPPWRVGNRRPA
ncbi:hypothetical protein FU658_05555 [Alkalisalibacterium limincola]|uniref:Uncharacterized protein n=1 Tax=Alkalisalibacterium limincola TaxID=2699169 RepID=A0A5C8KTK0_9GAMM|nr:hypothetical protein FU658_05555 [Alkalisalibacterium limincola]